MTKLGDLLLSARKRLGFSLRDAEDASGVSNAYISMIESGRRVDPHPNILKKLAEAYGLEIDEILKAAGYRDQEPQPDNEEAEIERLYREAMVDPAFAFGRRSKIKIDYPMKKVIAQMYKELKENRTRGK
jgi:HTH-type transcriptional regulator, competence development regulator